MSLSLQSPVSDIRIKKHPEVPVEVRELTPTLKCRAP
jgi:hypothetical protein